MMILIFWIRYKQVRDTEFYGWTGYFHQQIRDEGWNRNAWIRKGLSDIHTQIKLKKHVPVERNFMSWHMLSPTCTSLEWRKINWIWIIKNWCKYKRLYGKVSIRHKKIQLNFVYTCLSSSHQSLCFTSILTWKVKIRVFYSSKFVTFLILVSNAPPSCYTKNLTAFFLLT